MSIGHDTDDVRSLLGPYALDAVDDLERRAVDRLVADDTDAARELRSLQAAAAELGAATADEPPAALRASVLAAIATTPQVSATGGPGASAAHRGRADARARRRGLDRFSLAVASAAVVAVGVTGTLAWDSSRRAVEAEAEIQRLTAALTDPGAELLRSDVAGGGEAVALLTEDDAVLLAAGLPELPADRAYQLWTLRDGGALPAGVLDVEDGAVRAVAEGYRPGDGLAVTVEPAGGSEQPTTEPVVVLVQS